MGNTKKKPSTQDLLTFIKKEIKTWEDILINVNEKRKNAYVENYIYDAFDATEERWSRIRMRMPSNKNRIQAVERGMNYRSERDELRRSRYTIKSLNSYNKQFQERNCNLELRCKDMERTISKLEGCVSELNQRNERDHLASKHSANEDTMSKSKTLLKQEHADYREYEQKNRKLQQQLTDKDAEVQFLKTNIDSLKMQNNLVEERNDLRLGLSKLAGERLVDNNPAITDLSDPNRPTKLGEFYSELYDNEWTNALDVLHQNGHEDDIAIETLKLTLLNIYKFCENKAGMVLRQSTDAVNLLFDDYKQSIVPAYRKRKCILPEIQLQQRWKPKEQSSGVVSQIKEVSSASSEMVCHKDKLKIKAESKLIQLRKEVAVSMVPIVQEAYMEASWDTECLEVLKPFIMKCLHMAWMMVVQSPPMAFKRCGTDERFDNSMFKEYTKRGTYVDFMVWPVLLLEKDGQVVAKGIAQGKEN